MRRVILESPYAGSVWGRWRNRRYAVQCMRDSLLRGESPMLSHLLYTQALDDENPKERRLGIEAGLAWGPVAHATVVYTDLGISPGMRIGIDRAASEGRRVFYRSLYASAAYAPL